MSSSFSESCFGFCTSVASKMAPAHVPKDGAAAFGKFQDGFAEASSCRKLQLRRAFSARKNQSVASLEIGGRAQPPPFPPERSSIAACASEISLNRQYPDFHFPLHVARYSRAVDSMSFSPSAGYPDPFIASPSSFVCFENQSLDPRSASWPLHGLARVSGSLDLKI